MADKQPVNYYNTWEYASEVKAENAPEFHELVRFWKAYRRVTGKDSEEGCWVHTDIITDPAEAFTSFVKRGEYPPPEVMMALCATLDSYHRSRGKLSLEECFYGPLDRGKNQAARTADGALYEMFCISYLERHMNDPLNSVSEADYAEKFLEAAGLDQMDVDNFLRCCRRWKRKTGRFSKKSKLHEFSDT